MPPRILTDQEVAQYHRDGYVRLPGLFDAEEIDLLRKAREIDKAMRDDQNTLQMRDGEGGVIKLALWNDPEQDIYGLFSRCARVVDSVERVLDGEAYHWHSKLIQKDPFVGGAWRWHQDYGYWYYDNCLFPLMTSVMIAIDEATRENGCLQVLKSSHLIGRIDHARAGDQAGADLERVEAAEKVLERVYCILESGDALFLHCNTLHRSDMNKSPKPRWALICCYNAARNNPYQATRHASYKPLEKVPDSAIKEAGLVLTEKHFYERDPVKDY